MIPVAIRAIRNVLILMEIGLPVRALKIVFCNLGMAIRAVNPPGRFTGSFSLGIHIRVTFHARNRFMDGFIQDFARNCHRNLLTVNHFMNIRC